MPDPVEPKPLEKPAQSAPAPTDPALKARELELARKKLDADIAEQDKRLADAQKAIRAAATPATTTTPLEGKVTLDDKVPIQSEILAHQTLRSIANTIAARLNERLKNTRHFIIHRDADTAALLAIRVLRAQLGAVKAAYEALAADAGTATAKTESIEREVFGPEIAAATVATKTVLDLVALFRSDVDIRNYEFTVDEAVLVSMIAACFTADTRVYYPNLYPAALTPAGKEAADALLTSFGDLRERRTAAAAAVAGVQGDRKAALESQLSVLTTQHAAFEQALFSAPATGGAPPINAVFQAAAIDALLVAGAKLLYVKVQKARGSVRTRRWLWNHDVAYGGGAIVTVVAFAPDGTIELSDTLCAMMGHPAIPMDAKSADPDVQPSFATPKEPKNEPGKA